MSTGLSQRLQEYDLESIYYVKTLNECINWVCSLVLSSDGKLLSGTNDNTLKVWDLDSGQCIKTL